MAIATRNITRVYRTATPDQIESGLNWYGTAYDIAGSLADEHGTTREVAAGVLAALSPLNSWQANVNLATRFLAEGGLHAGYLSGGLAKARAILAGAPVLDILTSPKVQNFFHCILTRGLTTAVCVDRHALDVAMNVRHTDTTRPEIKGKRYTETVAAYQRAAVILSKEGQAVSAAQVQAIVWVTWRRRYWAEGAFDAAIAAL